jgi:hypothetical protein
VRSSSGGNLFSGNRSPSDPTLDIHNTTGTTVKAESNCWDDTDPSDQVQGSVDYLPLGADCGGGPGDPPILPPDNLHRTDIKD